MPLSADFVKVTLKLGAGMGVLSGKQRFTDLLAVVPMSVSNNSKPWVAGVCAGWAIGGVVEDVAALVIDRLFFGSDWHEVISRAKTAKSALIFIV